MAQNNEKYKINSFIVSINSLKLTLQMAGSLIPNVKAEVEIFIENPLSSRLLISLEDNKEFKLMAENRSPLSYCSSEHSLASCSRSRKVTPSLPDYEAATSQHPSNYSQPLFSAYNFIIDTFFVRRNCSPLIQIGLLM